MDKLPLEMTKTPAYWPEQQEAFYGACHYCIGVEAYRNTFRNDSGHDLQCLVNKSPIEQMVDEATGHDKVIISAFMDWVAENFYGLDKTNE